MTQHRSELSSSKPWSKSLSRSTNRHQAIAPQEANPSVPLRRPRQRDPRCAGQLQEDPSFHTPHQGWTHGCSALCKTQLANTRHLSGSLFPIPCVAQPRNGPFSP